jgi:vacuolar-type H+-ATPase catalytic subunit A/Vma1
MVLICSQASGFACDDTLVMLLTAKNPTSEFAKVIRTFTNDLTTLGTALKKGERTEYTPELAKVMDSWLEFSKRYLNNPPEEARNDLKWAEKTSQTAKTIGEIRRMVNEKRFSDAHNLVLDLSSRIGSFFEASGISDENQLFIDSSSQLTLLEKNILEQKPQDTLQIIAKLENTLGQYSGILPEVASGSFVMANSLLQQLKSETGQNKSALEQDKTFQQLKAAFEELRSHILMREWFPEPAKNKAGE